MKYLKIVSLILFVFLSTRCTYQNESKLLQKKVNISLTDSNATFNTIAFFKNLQNLAKTKIIFGHHHATAYGIGWNNQEGRSDVKDVTGSYPGLIGWDFGDLTKRTPVAEGTLKNLVVEAYNKGIVNIFAWHLDNVVTGNNFYDTTVVVKHILPGGSHHLKYKIILDSVAQFVKHTIGNDGRVVPIIFRPFHEFDGSWFWWGKNFCTRDEFKELWKFTVHYLRDVRNVRNILYAFSPDRNFNNEAEYLESYPGDEYVDIIGMDNYWDFTPGGDGLDAITSKLKIITKIAAEKNKIAAFTETGSEKVPEKDWWTEKLLRVMDNDSINISFVMVWRNAHLNHFYAPHPNHPSVENFIEFKNHPKIIFADELPDLFNYDMLLSK